MSGDDMSARVGNGAPTRDERHFRPNLSDESAARASGTQQ